MLSISTCLCRRFASISASPRCVKMVADDLAPTQPLVQLQQTKALVLLKINLHSLTSSVLFLPQMPIPATIPISIHTSQTVQQAKQPIPPCKKEKDHKQRCRDANNNKQNSCNRIRHQSIEEQNHHTDYRSNNKDTCDVAHTVLLPFMSSSYSIWTQFMGKMMLFSLYMCKIIYYIFCNLLLNLIS